jgi:hypothetical protein
MQSATTVSQLTRTPNLKLKNPTGMTGGWVTSRFQQCVFQQREKYGSIWIVDSRKWCLEWYSIN